MGRLDPLTLNLETPWGVYPKASATSLCDNDIFCLRAITLSLNPMYYLAFSAFTIVPKLSLTIIFPVFDIRLVVTVLVVVYPNGASKA